MSSNPPIIKAYKNQRVTDYLKDGMNALIRFNRHGLGDAIMFQPLYLRLKRLYPRVNFGLECNTDQQYFSETLKGDPDFIFDITFPETIDLIKSSSYTLSKPEACAVLELGIPWDRDLDFTWNPDRWNKELRIKDNCIGVAFQVSSCPDKGVKPEMGMMIWRRIKQKGFTPIEVTFNNPNANKSNGRISCIDYSCRDMESSVENLIAVISQCRGFVGVNTGTFCAAMCIKKGDVFHLLKRHPFIPYYKRYGSLAEMDCRDMDRLDWSALDAYLASR